MAFGARRRESGARRGWLYGLASVLVAPTGALAHHSISGVYDGNRQITVEGRVVEFQFINPHPFLIVATDFDAKLPQTWRLEMDNRYELAEIGITAATFMPGDRVIATGSAARAEAQSLYLMKLDRPADGLRYEQVGTSPRISRAGR
jgi:hypothetical protein